MMMPSKQSNNLVGSLACSCGMDQVLLWWMVFKREI